LFTSSHSVVSAAELWHQRLGHVGFSTIHKQIQHEMLHDMPSNLPLKDLQQVKCVACTFGKQTRKPFLPSTRSLQFPLELVVADLIGPISKPSGIRGGNYILVVTDAFTNYICTYSIKSKTEVLSKFQHFVNQMDN
jgi:hypothetical protein